MSSNTGDTTRTKAPIYHWDDPDGSWWSLEWDRTRGGFHAAKLTLDDNGNQIIVDVVGSDGPPLGSVAQLAAEMHRVLPDNLTRDLQVDALDQAALPSDDEARPPSSIHPPGDAPEERRLGARCRRASSPNGRPACAAGRSAFQVGPSRSTPKRASRHAGRCPPPRSPTRCRASRPQASTTTLRRSRPGSGSTRPSSRTSWQGRSPSSTSARSHRYATASTARLTICGAPSRPVASCTPTDRSTGPATSSHWRKAGHPPPPTSSSAAESRAKSPISSGSTTLRGSSPTPARPAPTPSTTSRSVR